MPSSSNLAGRGGRGGRSGRGGRNARVTEFIELPPLPPRIQLEDQGDLSRNLADVVPTISPTTLASSSNLAGKDARGSSSSRDTELAEIIPLQHPTNQLEDQSILALDPEVIVSPSIIIVGVEGNGQQDVSINGKRKRRKEFGSDEMCMCACMKIYDTTDMSNCKGINCSNRIRRTCVPLHWLCGKCVNKR